MQMTAFRCRLTSKRCFRCGGECVNHAYLSERDRRKQSDERIEKQLEERLQRAESETEEDKAYRASSRPCEIRGLRFCNGCKRCINRDGNSAPQMAVQLKRLLIGLEPLHRMSSEDARMQRMMIDIEG